MNYLHKPIEFGLECGWASDVRLWIATDLLKSHPLVCAVPDGEDSAGRQKLRLQTPEEAAERAVEMAASVFAMAEARGWVFEYDADRAGKLLEEVKGRQVAAESNAYELRSEIRKKLREKEPA